MFETSVVRVQARAPERRFGLLSVSVAAHLAAITGVVAASIATVQVPDHAPRQMDIYKVMTPPPILGSMGGGPKPKPAATQPVQPQKRETTPPRDVAPQIVPAHVTPQSNNDGPLTTPPGTDGAPAGDGQPLGVPWGSPIGVGTDGPPSNVQPVQPQPDVVYHVGEGVKAPVVIRRVSPAYPALAMKIRKSGFAIVECTIDKTGRIRDAHVVGSNFGAFEQPALEAVEQWQFAPGTKDGQPVDVQFELRVNFQIR